MEAKATRLITAAPDGFGNERTWLEFEDGKKLALPFAWRSEEFVLPGNVQILGEGRAFALYDESTRTGAFYYAAAGTPHWVIWQPCVRADFFDDMAPSWFAHSEMLARLA